MDKFLIDGPSKIKGKVSISGSKNASLPILAAANIGSEAFLEPDIETLPLILLGPSIRNLSITYFLILAT